jgi:hypothetical protein
MDKLDRNTRTEILKINLSSVSMIRIVSSTDGNETCNCAMVDTSDGFVLISSMVQISSDVLLDAEDNSTEIVVDGIEYELLKSVRVAPSTDSIEIDNHSSVSFEQFVDHLVKNGYNQNKINIPKLFKSVKEDLDNNGYSETEGNLLSMMDDCGVFAAAVN